MVTAPALVATAAEVSRATIVVSIATIVRLMVVVVSTEAEVALGQATVVDFAIKDQSPPRLNQKASAIFRRGFLGSRSRLTSGSGSVRPELTREPSYMKTVASAKTAHRLRRTEARTIWRTPTRRTGPMRWPRFSALEIVRWLT